MVMEEAGVVDVTIASKDVSFKFNTSAVVLPKLTNRTVPDWATLKEDYPEIRHLPLDVQGGPADRQVDLIIGQHISAQPDIYKKKLITTSVGSTIF